MRAAGLGRITNMESRTTPAGKPLKLTPLEAKREVQGILRPLALNSYTVTAHRLYSGLKKLPMGRVLVLIKVPNGDASTAAPEVQKLATQTPAMRGRNYLIALH